MVCLMLLQDILKSNTEQKISSASFKESNRLNELSQKLHADFIILCCYWIKAAVYSQQLAKNKDYSIAKNILTKYFQS